MAQNKQTHTDYIQGIILDDDPWQLVPSKYSRGRARSRFNRILQGIKRSHGIDPALPRPLSIPEQLQREAELDELLGRFRKP